MANKYGPIPTNKLNFNGTTFQKIDIWDLSGSNLSKIFHKNPTPQGLGFRNWLFSRKGPIIGDWGFENKARTCAIIVFTFFILFSMKEFGLIIFYNLIDNSSMGPSTIDLLYEISGIVIYLLMFIFLLIILALDDKFEYFRRIFVIPEPLAILLGTFVLFLDFIFVVTYGIVALLSGFDEQVFIDPNSDKNILIMSLLFINLAIAAPIVEELFFRGYLLDKLRNNFSDLISVLTTSIFFGLIHWSPYADYLLGSSDFSRVPTTLFGGFLYGFLRIKTGSIWPSIICHSIWNGTIFLILFL
tara:strand:- start:47 stop:946 length:900 start_codon:yes stop_codon:yes gene_type:complete